MTIFKRFHTDRIRDGAWRTGSPDRDFERVLHDVQAIHDHLEDSGSTTRSTRRP